MPPRRTRVNRELAASAELLRSIFESAVDAIVVIDSNGQIEAFNRAAERLFGYSEAEVLGRNVGMLMPTPYREEHNQYLARYLKTGVARIIGIGREVTCERRDGSRFPAQLSVGEMSVQGERKFTGILHDLTERVKMEKQLRDQSALTRLGEMAAVVAHEVKNPLTGIRGAVQVIGGRLPAGSKDAAILNEVVTRIDALNELLKDLLLFARPPQPRFAPVDVRPLLTRVADLIRQDQAFRELRIEVGETQASMTADPELLKIVIQNLLINSAHAMEGHGTIEITVSPGPGTLSLGIVDHGPGIPPDVREKLFTPFFTTKSRGTGLGLSTAKRFVEAHGGTMTVECPPDGGTIVTLNLPTELPVGP
jgi:two-component system sensor kinase FixL